jgi:hypothetical protein
MEKATTTLIVALAIGGLIGFGGGYYYMQDAATSSYEEGYAAGQDVAPQSYYTTPADLDFTWSDDDFNHAATVDASGNVAADTGDDEDINIENTGDVDAASVYITMTNPKTQAKGLDEDLDDALDYVNVYIDYGTLSKLYLIKEGEYLANRNLGELPAGSEIDVTVHVEFLEHDDGDFPDGKTLDCEIYIWEPGADNVETLEFTITT